MKGFMSPFYQIMSSIEEACLELIAHQSFANLFSNHFSWPKTIQRLLYAWIWCGLGCCPLSSVIMMCKIRVILGVGASLGWGLGCCRLASIIIMRRIRVILGVGAGHEWVVVV